MKLNEPIPGTFFETVKGIYKITNTDTGKCYIGQSRNIQSRVTSHFDQLSKGKHTTSELQHDWDNSNPLSFHVEIIEIVEGVDNRLLRESEIIHEIIANGGEVYNYSITPPESIKSRIKAKRRKRVLQNKTRKNAQDVLSLKNQSEVNSNGQTEGASHKSDKKTVRRKNDVFRSGEIPRPEPITPLASDKQELCVQETDLRTGKQGIDKEAEAERSPAASVDEDGRFGESNKYFEETLPECDYHDNEIGEYLGYSGVDSEQWDYDLRRFADNLKIGDDDGRIHLVWFLRTYIDHSVLEEIVEDIKEPMLYINVHRGVDYMAEIIEKYFPEYEYTPLTLSAARMTSTR